MTRFLIFSILGVLLLIGSIAEAATVSPTASFTGVNRIGYNIGNSDNNYGPNAITANYFDNPGFEPPTVTHLIKVATGATNSSFTDTSDNGSLGVSDWTGARLSVRNGASAGDQMTVTSYSAGHYTFNNCLDGLDNPIACPVLEQGASLAEILTSPTVMGGMSGPVHGQLGKWETADTHCGYATDNAFDGNGSAACDVSDGNTYAIKYFWDFAGVSTTNTGGVCSNDHVTPCTFNNAIIDCGSGNSCLLIPASGPLHPVVGPFTLRFWAAACNTTAGSPTIDVNLARQGGTNVNRVFSLVNDCNWHQYVNDFTGTDVGWSGAQNQNELIFQMFMTNSVAEAGAKIYVDDAYLGRPNAGNFRSEFLTTNSALNPGSIRYMGGGSTMSAPRDTLEGLLGCNQSQSGTDPDAPGTCDFQHGASVGVNGTSGDHILSGSQWSFSSADLYAIASIKASAPWFQISNMFSDDDLRNFIDNMCASVQFAYPNIPAVYIEQSNEEWNTGSPSYSVRYGNNDLGDHSLGYGQEAGRNFSIMSAEATARCPSVASKIHYVTNGITCNGSTQGAPLTGAANGGHPIPNTSQYGVDGALYYGINQTEPGDNITQTALYANAFLALVPTYVGPQGTGCMNGINGTGGSDWAFIGSNNFEAMYETGPNGYGGPATLEEYDLLEGGFTSAASMASSWLLAQQGQNQNGSGPLGRVPAQNEYQLTQLENGNPAGPIWGFAVDMDSDFGPSFPHLRPIGVGMQVVNAGIPRGGEFHVVSGLPSGVVANAYLSQGRWSAVLINETNTASSFSLTFPAGTLPANYKETANTNNIADNNEGSSSVYLKSHATNDTVVTCVSGACGIVLQPYTLMSIE